MRIMEIMDILWTYVYYGLMEIMDVDAATFYTTIQLSASAVITVQAGALPKHTRYFYTVDLSSM